MSKRASENSLAFIANKLRKLEKEIKRSRRRDRRDNPHNSSRSLSSSSSSSYQSSSSSRNPTPPAENVIGQDKCTNPPAEAIEIELPPTEAPASQQDEKQTETVGEIDVGMSPEIFEILGADPSTVTEYGPEINKDVAQRFEHIATSGLSKEVRKELLEKYTVPVNCKNVMNPYLNPEIKAAFTEQLVKRDKAIEGRQKQIAAGISCLGNILTKQLNADNKNHELLKGLMDAGRILCDIQHSESVTRRNFALYSVKSDLKDHLVTTKIDKFLFSEDLAETLRSAKAVTKSGTDLKVDNHKKKRPSHPPAAAAPNSVKNLNWRAGTAVRRQPSGPPRQHQPAAPPAQPRGTSSRNYRQQPRQNHRR